LRYLPDQPVFVAQEYEFSDRFFAASFQVIIGMTLYLKYIKINKIKINIRN